MWYTKSKVGNTEYHEYYKDPLTGKRRSVTVTMDGEPTNTKAKLATAELLRLISEREAALPTDDLTLSELLERYINYQSKVVKHSTWRRNEFTLNVVVRQIGPNVKVNRLTAGYIRDRLLEKTTNPTTLNEYIKRIKAMLRWAYDSDLTDNVAVTAKLKRFKDDKQTSESLKPEDKYFEPDQLTDILTYMKGSQEYWYMLTKFLVLSGLRIGEAIALESSDVTADHISITKTFDVINREVTPPKTAASRRDVYIQPELAEVIAEIKRYTRNQDILLGTRSEHFFHNSNGDRIAYAAFAKYVKETCERVIGVRRTPHAFRHTHASLLFAEGVSIDTISRRLGHENSKITRDIYLHIVEKVREKDKEILAGKRLIS